MTLSEVDWGKILEYRDGDLYWKVQPTRSRVPIGSKAGSNKRGLYRTVGYKYRTFLAHRIIWEIVYGPIPKDMIIDHIDGDGFNNKLENLRLVTPSQNARNRKGHREGKVMGLWQDPKTKKWRSYLNLGSYTTREEAEGIIIKVKKLLEDACVQF